MPFVKCSKGALIPLHLRNSIASRPLRIYIFKCCEVAAFQIVKYAKRFPEDSWSPKEGP